MCLPKDTESGYLQTLLCVTPSSVDRQVIWNLIARKHCV
jgi:hypothetical protein